MQVYQINDNGTLRNFGSQKQADKQAELLGLAPSTPITLSDGPRRRETHIGEIIDIPQVELDALDAARASELAEAKTKEMDKAYESAVQNGFTSSALGTPHTYKSHSEAQTDLIGLKACNRPRNVWCSADGGATWSMVQHTVVEIEQVLNDGADTKEAEFNNLVARQTQIATIQADTILTDAEKVAAIQAITW